MSAHVAAQRHCQRHLSLLVPQQLARTPGCRIAWPVLSAEQPSLLAGEAVTQAMSGVMGVHGRDHGTPRRLAIDVVAAAAGSLAALGSLAAMVGRRRGRAISSVVTYPLHAALLLISHHITAATCGDPWEPAPGGDGPGPPFHTADGHWFELEALSPESWQGFWGRLGVEGSVLSASWLAFAFRQNTARCRLPTRLHDAASTHTLTELMSVAAASSVALCRIRDIADVARDAGPFDGGRPWSIIPAAAGRGGMTPPLDAGGEPDGLGDAEPSSVPLAGMRVVEVASRIQGPLAGQLLRMLGADVIKVEPPGGDPARDVPPFAGEAGAAFVAYNHGKRAVELDYKQAAGRTALADLITDADVFLHNLRTGRAEQLGFGYEEASTRNPSLIYAHASGWGPRADIGLPSLATDSLVQAHAAMGWALNPPGEQPFPSRMTVVDTFAGVVAAEAVLGALAQRAESGRGARVDTSLLSSALDVEAVLLDAAAEGQRMRDPRDRWTSLDYPVRTTDGWLVIEAADADSLRRVAAACGIQAHAGSVAADRIVGAIGGRSAREWESVLRAAGVPSAAVCADLTTLPSSVHASALESLDGRCYAPSPPWRFIEH